MEHIIYPYQAVWRRRSVMVIYSPLDALLNSIGQGSRSLELPELRILKGKSASRYLVPENKKWSKLRPVAIKITLSRMNLDKWSYNTR